MLQSTLNECKKIDATFDKYLNKNKTFKEEDIDNIIDEEDDDTISEE